MDSVDGLKSASPSSSEDPVAYSTNTLKNLDALLAKQSYVNGDEMSMEDIRWFAAVSESHKKDYPSLRRWYNHVLFNLVACLPDDAQGVELVGNGATSSPSPDDDMAKVRMVLDRARKGIIWTIYRQRVNKFIVGLGDPEYDMPYPVEGMGEKKPSTKEERAMYRGLDLQVRTLRKLELMKQQIQQKQVQREEPLSQGPSSHQ